MEFTDIQEDIAKNSDMYSAILVQWLYTDIVLHIIKELIGIRKV